jgi:endonuclease YncB( thermonuclease family)
MGWARFFVLAWIIVLPAAAAPREPSGAALTALPMIGAGTVAEIGDNDEIRLTDGRVIRLDGIALPVPPLGRPPDRPWPAADSAHMVLRDLLNGRAIKLYGDVAAIDRHGRLVAQVRREDGAWIEAALLARGAARVDIDPAHPDLIPRLLAWEAKARQRRRGLWAEPAYAVRGINRLEHESGSYQLVEGTPREAVERGGAIWLEFGAAGQGFAARIARPARASFAEAGLDPTGLVGHPIRLRGWIIYLGRPVLDLLHPAAIERLRRARRH